MINPLGGFSGASGNNAMSWMIAQSDMDRTALIRDFENAIAAGLNPYNDTVRNEIFSNRGVSEKTLTAMDKQILNRRVEAAYQAYKNRRY